MKRKVKLTGKQRLEIAKGVLEECLIFAEDNTEEFVKPLKNGKNVLNEFSGLKDIEIEEEEKQ